MKISFKKFKSFEKKTDVSIKRFNVLIGKNSAGKSTLSQAIKYFSAIYSSNDPFIGRSLTIGSLLTINPKDYNNRRNKNIPRKWFDESIANESYFYTPLVIHNQSSGSSRYKQSTVPDATVNTSIMGITSLEPRTLSDALSFEYEFFNWTPSSLSFIPSKKTGKSMGEYIDFINPKNESIPHITMSFKDLDEAKMEIDSKIKAIRNPNDVTARLTSDFKLQESQLTNFHNAKMQKLIMKFKTVQSLFARINQHSSISHAKNITKQIQDYERKSRKFRLATQEHEAQKRVEFELLSMRHKEILQKELKKNDRHLKKLIEKKRELENILEHSMQRWRNMTAHNNPVLIPSDITSISSKSKANNLLNKYIKSIYSEISEKDHISMHGDFSNPSSETLDQLKAVYDNINTWATSNGKITTYHNSEMNIYKINSNNRFLDGFTSMVSKDREEHAFGAFIRYDQASYMAKKTNKLVEGILIDIFEPLLESTDKPFKDWYSYNLKNKSFSSEKYSTIMKKSPALNTGNKKIPRIFNYTDNGSTRLKSNYAYASLVNVSKKTPGLSSLSLSKRSYEHFKSILPDDHNISLKLNKNIDVVKNMYREMKKTQSTPPMVTLGSLSIEHILSPEFLFADTLTKTREKGLGIQAKYVSPYVGDIFSHDTLGFNFKFSNRSKNQKNYKNIDAVADIIKFLRSIGLGDTFKYLHGIRGKHNGYNSFRIDTHAEHVNTGKDITGWGRLINMLEMDNPFSELLVLSVYIDLVKRMVENMMTDNIFYNSEQVFLKNKDKIKKTAKKYKVTQKSIIHQAGIIQRHLLSNIITEVEFNIREYLFTNQTRLINSFDFSSLNSTPSMTIVTPKTIFSHKKRFSSKEMVDWLGDSFKEILEQDRFNTDAEYDTKHPTLSRFVKFINTSIEKVFSEDKSFFSIAIQPVYEYDQRQKTFLDMFKVKIKENTSKNIFTLSETGSGNAALISMLAQLYPIFTKNDKAVKSIQAIRNNKSLNESRNTPIVTIKEPENYLHPNLCAGFIGFIFENAFGTEGVDENVISKVNAKFIIETHSEVVLRKVQSSMKSLKLSDFESAHLLSKESPDFTAYNPDKDPKESLVNIMYIHKDKNGSKIKNLGLKKNGFLSENIPSGFFDINSDLISDLWKDDKE